MRKTLSTNIKSSPARSTAARFEVWAASYMVQGQTEKEARDFYKYYVHEKGDWEAATNLVETMGLSTGILEPRHA